MTSYSNGVGTDVFRLAPSAKLLGTRHFPGLSFDRVRGDARVLDLWDGSPRR